MLLSHSLVYIALELVIACLAVAGNVLVCWAVCLNSNLQSITNYFVVSLAVADIAVGLLAIPFSIVISTGFCADFHGCLFIACFVLVLTQSSIFSLLAIAVDRYIAIKIPLRYTSLVTGSRAKGIIAVCWVLSVGIGLTPMLGWNMGVNATNSSVCPYGMTECLFEGVVTLEYMVYFNFFGCVLVPLVAMLAIYARIFMAARRQLRLMELKQVSTHGNAHRQSSNSSSCRSTLQKEVHAAKSLAILVGLFALCWLPLHIINCFNLMCHDCGRPHIWVMNIAIIFSHANSVVNPIIYAYRIREFRHTFRRILRQHVLGQRQDCCMGKSGDRGMGGSSSTKRASTQISMDVSCSTVINSYALEPYLDSSRHITPRDVTLTSCHRTSRLEPVSIRYFPNGHPVEDSSFAPSGQDCVMGSVVQGGLEPPFLKGTVGVLEVEDSGSILFMNQLPLPPAHSSPTISVELTEVS